MRMNRILPIAVPSLAWPLFDASTHKSPDQSVQFGLIPQAGPNTYGYSEGAAQCKIVFGQGWDLAIFDSTDQVSEVTTFVANGGFREAFWVGYKNSATGQVDHFGDAPKITFRWNRENIANPEPNGIDTDCVRMKDALFNDVSCTMDRTGPVSDGIGMGVICRHYPSQEVNTKKSSSGQYHCDVAAIGLAVATDPKYIFKCKKGRFDRQNLIVRLGKDQKQKWLSSDCTVKCKLDKEGKNKLSANFECHPVLDENNKIIGARSVYDERGFQQYQQICGGGCAPSAIREYMGPTGAQVSTGLCNKGIDLHSPNNLIPKSSCFFTCDSADGQNQFKTKKKLSCFCEGATHRTCSWKVKINRAYQPLDTKNGKSNKFYLPLLFDEEKCNVSPTTTTTTKLTTTTSNSRTTLTTNTSSATTATTTPTTTTTTTKTTVPTTTTAATTTTTTTTVTTSTTTSICYLPTDNAASGLTGGKGTFTEIKCNEGEQLDNGDWIVPLGAHCFAHCVEPYRFESGKNRWKCSTPVPENKLQSSQWRKMLRERSSYFNGNEVIPWGFTSTGSNYLDAAHGGCKYKIEAGHERCPPRDLMDFETNDAVIWECDDGFESGSQCVKKCNTEQDWMMNVKYWQAKVNVECYCKGTCQWKGLLTKCSRRGCNEPPPVEQPGSDHSLGHKSAMCETLLGEPVDYAAALSDNLWSDRVRCWNECKPGYTGFPIFQGGNGPYATCICTTGIYANPNPTVEEGPIIDTCTFDKKEIARCVEAACDTNMETLAIEFAKGFRGLATDDFTPDTSHFGPLECDEGGLWDFGDAQFDGKAKPGTYCRVTCKDGYKPALRHVATNTNLVIDMPRQMLMGCGQSFYWKYEWTVFTNNWDRHGNCDKDNEYACGNYPACVPE